MKKIELNVKPRYFYKNNNFETLDIILPDLVLRLEDLVILNEENEKRERL